MRTGIVGFGSAVVVAALMGCGSSSGSSDGGSTGGGFTTSVPAGTKLTMLTPAQATQLCNDFNASSQAALTVDLCKYLALVETETATAFATQPPSDTDLRATCTEAYNGCLSEDGGTRTSTCDATAFAAEPSTCLATVGDLKTCLNDDTAASNQLFGSLPSCSSLTAASLASALATLDTDGGAGPAEPVSCSKLDSTCDMPTASMSALKR